MGNSWARLAIGMVACYSAIPFLILKIGGEMRGLLETV
jgi:hypothetical protein